MTLSKAIRRLATCLMAAALALPLIAAPVLAGSARPAASMTVALQLDCASVPNTVQAQSVLRTAGLCAYATRGGGITPDTTVNGNCGSLSINVFNEGGGWMEWKGEITSSLGPFIVASYGGSWDNFQGGFGPVGRSFGPGLTSDWLDIFAILTGPGHVVGQINWAQDTLWWGATCTNTAVVGASTTVTR